MQAYHFFSPLLAPTGPGRRSTGRRFLPPPLNYPPCPGRRPACRSRARCRCGSIVVRTGCKPGFREFIQKLGRDQAILAFAGRNCGRQGVMPPASSCARMARTWR